MLFKRGMGSATFLDTKKPFVVRGKEWRPEELSSLVLKKMVQMASDHLGPGVKLQSHLVPAGHSFGLGFAVRTHAGMAPFPGSVGQFFWSGMAGTFFWIDPKEELFAVFMSQGPGQREYFRTMLRSLVYAALE